MDSGVMFRRRFAGQRHAAESRLDIVLLLSAVMRDSWLAEVCSKFRVSVAWPSCPLHASAAVRPARRRARVR